MATSNAWYWWVLPVVALVGFVVYESILQGRDDAVRKDGMPASARVVSAAQTGSWVNNNPVVDLVLSVDSGGGQPYQVHLKSTIPQTHLAAVQPGSALKLKVDPEDAQRVVLDEPWAR